MFTFLNFLQIPVGPVAEIDFSSARAKKQRLDNAISGSTPVTKVTLKTTIPHVLPGTDTYKEFFEAINRNCPRSVALIMKEDYYHRFIPKSATTARSKPVFGLRTNTTSIYHPKTSNSCAKTMYYQICHWLTSEQLRAKQGNRQA